MARPAGLSAAWVAVLTAVTLAAFAANSIFNRLALASRSIDPAAFSAVRLAAGAAALALVASLRSGPGPQSHGSWRSALALFAYAAAFSFAYVTLDAGVGALVLFGAVQATMILAGLMVGERPGAAQWTGLALALAGLTVLAVPGATAPSPIGLILMAFAGGSWGVYSLRGRRIADPIAATHGNFTRTLPMALALVAGFGILRNLHLSRTGLLWAVLSGAVTSGFGYVVWYAVVRQISATRAAIVQLAVPVLTAVAGVVILGEAVTVRLLTAGAVILGGVALAMAGREPAAPRAAVGVPGARSAQAGDDH